MSVADSITSALRRFGRAMVLRRLTQGPVSTQVPFDVTVYGRSKGYKPADLVGGIVQGDTEITITDAEIAAAQWPGPPKKGDRIVLDGRTTTVQAVETKYLGTTVLVHVCQVRG